MSASPSAITGCVSGWTIDTLASHVEGIRSMQEKLDAERDRRYTDVSTEREKALKIKESGDAAALELARQIQTYKDTQHNDLRKQIDSERGLYARKSDVAALGEKIEAQLKPVHDFMAVTAGHTSGAKDSKANIAWVVALIASFIAIGSFLFRASPALSPAPQIIYVPAQPGTLIPSSQPPSPER